MFLTPSGIRKVHSARECVMRQGAERVPVVVEVLDVSLCKVALRASVVLGRGGIDWFVAAKLCLWFDQY